MGDDARHNQSAYAGRFYSAEVADLFASEYGWTIPDLDEATPMELQELAEVIIAKRKAKQERETILYLALEEQKQVFELVEIDGKPCVKVHREQYEQYRMNELAGQIVLAVVASGFSPPKDLSKIVPAPPWQSVIDKHELKKAKKKAEERGLKVPEVK